VLFRALVALALAAPLTACGGSVRAPIPPADRPERPLPPAYRGPIADAHDFARSPDRRTVVYSALIPDGPYALFTRDVENGRRRQLTHPPLTGNDEAPRWSPDGKRLLFERGGDVHVVNADGTGEGVVAEYARDAAWSPDGSSIAYIKKAPYIVDERLLVASGDRLRAVSELGSYTRYVWRPDGRALAYRSQQSVAVRLYVADAPEFRARPLDDPPDWARSLLGEPLRHRYTPPPDGR
jgi:dipeptidyl aminopeptidase/acylaminoacyl peptidase